MLAQRRPVWAALSELFLDTEVRFFLPSVARDCAASPFTLEVLDRIFWVEVFPEAFGNLLQVAGEWAILTLDEAALVERASRGSVPRLEKWLAQSLVKADWQLTRAMIERLRATAVASRGPLVLAWDVLCHRYFEAPAVKLVVPLEPKLATLREAGFSLAEEWAWFEPHARKALLPAEARERPMRVATVVAALNG